MPHDQLPPFVLKDGETFAMLDARGEISPETHPDSGIFHRGARHVSRLQLLLWDYPPAVLSSTERGEMGVHVSHLSSDVGPPHVPGGDRPPPGAVHLERSTLLTPTACLQQLVFTSYAAGTLRMPLTLRFDADFRDIFEVRGNRRRARGRSVHDLKPRGSVWVYRGLDDEDRCTALRIGEAVEGGGEDHLRLSLDLEPRCPRRLALVLDFQARLAAPGGGAADAGGGIRGGAGGHHRALPRCPPAGRGRDHRQSRLQCLAGPLLLGRPSALHPSRPRPLPLCGGALVQLSLRPGRHPHRPPAAPGGAPAGPGGAGLPGRAPGQPPGSGQRRRTGQDPARSPPRGDGGPRGGALPAVLRQRRCHPTVRDAGPATTWPAAPTAISWPRCCRPWRRQWPGSMGPRAPASMASCATSARPRAACATRAGRIPTTPSTMPTAGWPGVDRPLRGAGLRVWGPPGDGGDPGGLRRRRTGLRTCGRPPRRSGDASTRPSGATPSAPMPSPSMARGTPAPCDPPTPATASGPGSPIGTLPPRSPGSCWPPRASTAGGCAPSTSGRPATAR